MKLFSNLNFGKLKEGLSKTKDKIVNKITEVVTGKAKLDSEILDELEETLIASDMGFAISEIIIEDLKKKMKSSSDRSPEKLTETIKESLSHILADSKSSKDYAPEIEKYKPYVILIVGINGVGKTTTIGKLAYNFKNSGLKVIIGAADTFRAAANEQLEIWAQRAGVEIVQKGQGSDPSSVVFETAEKALKDKHDVILIDTAGRLHTKLNLMEELKKIKRVLTKVIPHAPNETFLVLDAATGQNAINQLQEFTKATEVSGLVITKLDGTAKGGVIFQICHKEKIPVRYIGVGEGIEDLQTFAPKEFVEALFK